ncbi:MAG: diguanylate cyclase domain-containing protein [Burkholderiaceae bacterium]
MTTVPKVLRPKISKAGKSLTEVVDQSEQIKEVVEECGTELLSVNTVLKEELPDLTSLPEIEGALEKSETIETKVQEAAEELSIVNQALKDEIGERLSLEKQLAAANEREESARHASTHDLLTGLPNRLLFNDRLEHGLAQAKRHGWNIAVMFLDLDGFKSINDSYGHDVGDSVLQIIAQRLKKNTRDDDTISRHGGDEFLYLLMEVQNEETITLIAKKIIKAIQEPCDVHIRNVMTSLQVDTSIGISMFPKNGTTAESLVKSADKAMYHAKRTKSGYAFAE